MQFCDMLAWNCRKFASISAYDYHSLYHAHFIHLDTRRLVYDETFALAPRSPPQLPMSPGVTTLSHTCGRNGHPRNQAKQSSLAAELFALERCLKIKERQLQIKERRLQIKEGLLQAVGTTGQTAITAANVARQTSAFLQEAAQMEGGAEVAEVLLSLAQALTEDTSPKAAASVLEEIEKVAEKMDKESEVSKPSIKWRS